MVKSYYCLLIVVLLWGLGTQEAWAQPNNPRFDVLEQDLATYAVDYPRIDKEIDISITGSLQEFAIAFSKETKLNLTIAPSIQQQIVTNFADTRPRDILLHLCRFYELDLTFSGSIISLIPYRTPTKPYTEKEIAATYNAFNDKLELTLKRDTLDQVVKKISQVANKNVITSRDASTAIVSGFIGKTNFEDALEQLATRNGLSLRKDDKGYYVFELDNGNNQALQNPNRGNFNNPNQGGRGNNRPGGNGNGGGSGLANVQIGADSLGRPQIDVDATDAPIAQLIKDVSDRTGTNYFLFAEPTGNISLRMQGVSYETFLDQILRGSEFGYKVENQVYLIGSRKQEGLRETRMYQLQYRTVKELQTFIPADLGQNVEIKEFIDLNSLILSGSAANIAEVATFLDALDRPTPVVMIELLILDVQFNRETRAGFEAGLATEPPPAGGTILPSVNFTFSSEAINRLLGTLAGNGIVNLGQVRSNFYATLQAVEDDGYVITRSKPRLSTLNGQEANITIGETRYYLDQRTTLQGNQNPVTVQDRRFTAVNADFTVRILPVVSGDEHVTLEIEVSQSDFIGLLQNDAPPAQVNRSFTSNIRMLNGELIVLGGLETKTVENTGTGVPLLSRIPIIKWFFGNRRRAKNKSRLLIFVKPTVIY